MIALIASFLISRRPGLTLPHARRLATLGLCVVGIVLLLAAFALWLRLHTQAAVQVDRNVSKVEAVSRAREADERAHGAAAGKSKEVSDANERAREAAAGSDDPLGDGLRSLRDDANRDRPPAR